jgi:hypothetical protein
MTTRLILGNLLIILAFMICTSFYCGESFIGGECVKRLDGKMYFVLLTINILGGIVYFIKTRKNILITLLVNILIATIFYIFLATMHSISKAGLF